MHKIGGLLKKYRAVILYFIYGGLTTLLNLILYTLFTRLFHWQELVANLVAWPICVLFSFFVNKYRVFRSQSGGFWKELGLFYGSRLFSGGLDMLIMWLGLLLGGALPVLGGWRFYDLAVKVVDNIAVILLNLLFTLLLFGKKKGIAGKNAQENSDGKEDASLKTGGGADEKTIAAASGTTGDINALTETVPQEADVSLQSLQEQATHNEKEDA